MSFALRPYQETAVEALRAAYRAGRRAPLFQLATGGGKTFVFCYIGLNAAARGKRVCILVHRQELLLQSSRSLSDLGVEHGLIAPGHSPTSDLVQVASVQTLARRVETDRGRRFTGFDLVVSDEAHHAVAGSWSKIFAAMPKAKILGVTATPCRMDGKGLGEVFDALIQGPTITELTSLGYLVPSVVYAPSSAIDMKGVRSRGGDFVREEMTAAVDKPKITGSAVEHYARLCPGVPAIAFCASIKHAEHVASEFMAAGIKAASIDGAMDDGHRQNLIRALGDGRIKVLTSCDIVSEGTDIPAVGAAILLRPTKSTGLFLQQVGRALRTSPGKAKAIILDHVGNVGRHGMPDEERVWSLDKGVERKKKAADEDDLAVRQCPSCYAVHTPAPRCPACGYAYEAKPRQIAEVDGELKQVERSAIEIARAIPLKDVLRTAQTREQLEKLAQERGYQKKWVDHILASRQQYRRAG